MLAKTDFQSQNHFFPATAVLNHFNTKMPSAVICDFRRYGDF